MMGRWRLIDGAGPQDTEHRREEVLSVVEFTRGRRDYQNGAALGNEMYYQLETIEERERFKGWIFAECMRLLDWTRGPVSPGQKLKRDYTVLESIVCLDCGGIKPLGEMLCKHCFQGLVWPEAAEILRSIRPGEGMLPAYLKTIGATWKVERWGDLAETYLKALKQQPGDSTLLERLEIIHQGYATALSEQKIILAGYRRGRS
jgi:hypothetical protein